MSDAEQATSGVLEPDSDDDSESSRRSRLAPSGVSEDDLYPIVSAAKKARAAGSTGRQVNERLNERPVRV